MGLSSATLLGLTQLPGGVPKGYLRVLSFNEDSVLVDQRTVQLSTAALNNYETLSTGQLLVQQNGYVSVYVGNESAVDVYFDDLTIEHRPGLQVQENQYDPFGLDLAGVSGAAPGLRLKNFYQFNGKERQNELGLGWSDYGARLYDGQLGRWHVVDPISDDLEQESYSTYHYVYDNPVRYQDPDGRGPGDKILGFAAAVVDNVSLGLTNVRSVAAAHASSASDFNQGQNYGDAFSLLYALGEQSGGNAASAGGLALAPETMGGGLALTAAGQGIALHGRGMAVLAAGNLVSQKGRIAENSKEGRDREDADHADLKKANPDASVQRERYLRSKDGKIAKDPVSKEARRIDHAVIKDGKVTDLVETTSLGASKKAQALKEARIRDAGGTYIRDKQTRKLLDVKDVPTRLNRR